MKTVTKWRRYYNIMYGFIHFATAGLSMGIVLGLVFWILTRGELPFFIILSTIFTSLIGSTILFFPKSLDVAQTYLRKEKFVGKDAIEIVARMIVRSKDNTHQIRKTKLNMVTVDEILQALVHFETLDNSGQIVFDSYVAGGNLSDILARIGTTANRRLVAVIEKKHTGTISVKHFLGIEPHLTSDKDPIDFPRLLPWPHLLLMEKWPEGIYLFRLTVDGQYYAGDTWHQSEAEARNQADYEYGDSLGAWREVPPEVRGVEAIIAFATAGSTNGEG